MRKLLLCFMAIFFTYNLLAEDKPLTLDLTSAKIYLNGGELTHNGKIKLKEGYNEVVLKGFAFNLNPNSISVKVSGSGSVQSVTNSVKDTNSATYPKEIKLLEDSLKLVNIEIEKLNNIIQSIDFEMDFINKNLNLNKKDNPIVPSEMNEMADFLYSRVLENKNAKFETNLEINKWREKYSNISGRISVFQAEYNKQFKRDQLINVSIYTPKDEEVKIEVVYYTPSSGWSAFYEARIDEINKPFDLMLKANVWQATGFDWKNIPITISSKAPTFNNNLPVLSSVYLDFIDTYQKRTSYVGENSASPLSVRDVQVTSAGSKTITESITYDDEVAADAPGYNDRYDKKYKTLTQESGQSYSSFEFTSVNNYNIPCDAKKQLIEVEKFSVDATFDYYTAPKAQQDAFLVAKSPNKFGMEMLSGDVNVYFEKSFIGKTYLDFNTISDTIKLSLGIDKGVAVKREVIKDYTESKFLTSNIERSFGYRMTIKNNKKQKITVNMEDIIPIARNENIEIKVINLSGGDHDDTKGKVNWKIELEPGKSVTKELVFSVKHPKNRRINNY